jgi:hypothetical protein
MDAKNTHTTFGITVTEVPAEREYRTNPPRLPALDPSVSPLATERITILENLHKSRRDSLDKLAKAEQGILDVVQAFHGFDDFVGQKAKTLFCPRAPVTIQGLVDLLSAEPPSPPSKRQLAAEALLLVHKVHPSATNLQTLMQTDRRTDALVRHALLEDLGFTSVGELVPLFKEVIAAQQEKRELYNRVASACTLMMSKLTALAKVVGDPETTSLVNRYTSCVRKMVKDSEEVRLHKFASAGADGVSWSATQPTRHDLRELAESGEFVLETLRKGVMEALPNLHRYEGRIQRAVSGTFPFRAIFRGDSLSSEEALLVQYATIKVPSSRDASPGDATPASTSRLNRALRSLESQRGAEMIRSTISYLEQEDAQGVAWLTHDQATFLRGWSDDVETQRREALDRQIAASQLAAPVEKEAPSKDARGPRAPSVEPTSEEFVSAIFGEHILSTITEKLGTLPPLAQIEERVVDLERVAGIVLGPKASDQCFALVSKIVSLNPHILTTAEFNQYIATLSQTALRIEKMRISAPMYDLLATTSRFASLSALAETNDRLDMASGYVDAVTTLNRAQLPGEAIMALLRYGFFFRGRLQFGVCVGEDRMVLENVDKQSPDSFQRKELEKGLTVLHRAGIIERPTRGQGSSLKRATISGTKHERELSKALAWVIANPDPRVEF